MADKKKPVMGIKFNLVKNKNMSNKPFIDMDTSMDKIKNETKEIVSNKDLANKKVKKEKRKSNLELFKEEMIKEQEIREQKNKLLSGDVPSVPVHVLAALSTNTNVPYTLNDNATFSNNNNAFKLDQETTNVYISNLPKSISEEQLCEICGEIGPLASFKIVRPKNEIESYRPTNTAFVAYMERATAEKAADFLDGREIDGVKLSIGWGKCISIPLHPVYTKESKSFKRLPFNATITTSNVISEVPIDLKTTVVYVKFPTDKYVMSLINRMCEFLIKEGPLFEAYIMNKEINNPVFRFLFDSYTPEHIYYRWRVFSLLQGDSMYEWSEKEFYMFKNGSIWIPPKRIQLTCESKPNIGKIVRKLLSDKHRYQLEKMLRELDLSREKIGKVMVWSLEHASFCQEIVECISESLMIYSTPLNTKIARLFVINDILYNSSCKLPHASFYRRYFEEKLPEIFEHFHSYHMRLDSKIQSERLKKSVIEVLSVWKDLKLYPSHFIVSIQNIFLNIIVYDEGLIAETEEESDIDGVPIENNDDEDIDGVPMNDDDLGNLSDDIDGIPMSNEEIMSSKRSFYD